MFFVIRAFPHAEEKAKLILLKLEQKDALHILKQVLNNLSLLTRAVCLNSEAGAGRASLLKSKFQPGQRVELIRAGRGDDEVTSSGTIVQGFEGVFDTCYKVKLDNGLYKEAVPEDEISDKVTSDMGDLFGDW